MIEKKKRHRRTKAEVLAAKVQEVQKAKIIEEIKDPATPVSAIPSIEPLPLFGPEKNESVEASTGGFDPGVDAKILEEGLAEIVSEDIPRFLNNGVILFRLDNRLQINPPSRGRVALWAKFALPWLEKNFPNFNKDYFLYIMTASLFCSMFELKKGNKKVEEVKKLDQGVENAGTTSNS